VRACMVIDRSVTNPGCGPALHVSGSWRCCMRHPWISCEAVMVDLQAQWHVLQLYMTALSCCYFPPPAATFHHLLLLSTTCCYFPPPAATFHHLLLLSTTCCYFPPPHLHKQHCHTMPCYPTATSTPIPSPPSAGTALPRHVSLLYSQRPQPDALLHCHITLHCPTATPTNTTNTKVMQRPTAVFVPCSTAASTDL
jgi:hypothetical protein